MQPIGTLPISFQNILVSKCLFYSIYILLQYVDHVFIFKTFYRLLNVLYMLCHLKALEMVPLPLWVINKFNC